MVCAHTTCVYLMQCVCFGVSINYTAVTECIHCAWADSHDSSTHLGALFTMRGIKAARLWLWAPFLHAFTKCVTRRQRERAENCSRRGASSCAVNWRTWCVRHYYTRALRVCDLCLIYLVQRQMRNFSQQVARYGAGPLLRAAHLYLLCDPAREESFLIR